MVFIPRQPLKDSNNSENSSDSFILRVQFSFGSFDLDAIFPELLISFTHSYLFDLQRIQETMRDSAKTYDTVMVKIQDVALISSSSNFSNFSTLTYGTKL